MDKEKEKINWTRVGSSGRQKLQIVFSYILLYPKVHLLLKLAPFDQPTHNFNAEIPRLGKPSKHFPDQFNSHLNQSIKSKVKIQLQYHYPY